VVCENIRKSAEGVFDWQRFLLEHVNCSSRNFSGRQCVNQRRFINIGPRAVLIRNDVGFIKESSAFPTVPRLLALRTKCIVTNPLRGIVGFLERGARLCGGFFLRPNFDSTQSRSFPNFSNLSDRRADVA